MATDYFKLGTGEPFTDKTDAGDDAVAKGIAIKVDNAPDGIESWRMSYNFDTSSVDVKYSGRTNEQAVDDFKADKDAETLAEATAGATRAAAERDAEDA